MSIAATSEIVTGPIWIVRQFDSRRAGTLFRAQRLIARFQASSFHAIIGLMLTDVCRAGKLSLCAPRPESDLLDFP